jgi:hypothetical protein
MGKRPKEYRLHHIRPEGIPTTGHGNGGGADPSDPSDRFNTSDLPAAAVAKNTLIPPPLRATIPSMFTLPH